MKAKKHLGQHFLRSTKALTQIIEAGSLSKKDLVLEIGPGEGVLTERLLNLSGKVVAVEKDSSLIPLLESKFGEQLNNKTLIIEDEDALLFDPSKLKSFIDLNYKLIANIPYYITGAIIEKYLSAQYQPKTMVLLIQKEVAERIVSKDGKESILSIAVKVYGKPKIIAKVPPGAFAPAPTVDSAILSVDNISRDYFLDCDEKLFFEVLKFIFGKKRKQIGGTLSDLLENKDLAKEVLNNSGIDIKTRPEELDIYSWKKIIQNIEISRRGV